MGGPIRGKRYYFRVARHPPTIQQRVRPELLIPPNRTSTHWFFVEASRASNFLRLGLSAPG